MIGTAMTALEAPFDVGSGIHEPDLERAAVVEVCLDIRPELETCPVPAAAAVPPNLDASGAAAIIADLDSRGTTGP